MPKKKKIKKIKYLKNLKVRIKTPIKAVEKKSSVAGPDEKPEIKKVKNNQLRKSIQPKRLCSFKTWGWKNNCY